MCGCEGTWKIMKTRDLLQFGWKGFSFYVWFWFWVPFSYTLSYWNKTGSFFFLKFLFGSNHFRYTTDYWCWELRRRCTLVDGPLFIWMLSLSLCVLCYPLHACHQQHLLSCSRIEVTLIYFGFHHLNVFNSIYYRWYSLSQLFFFLISKKVMIIKTHTKIVILVF